MKWIKEKLSDIKDKVIALGNWMYENTPVLMSASLLIFFLASASILLTAMFDLIWLTGVFYAIGGVVGLVGLVLNLRKTSLLEKATMEARAKENARNARISELNKEPVNSPISLS